MIIERKLIVYVLSMLGIFTCSYGWKTPLSLVKGTSNWGTLCLRCQPGKSAEEEVSGMPDLDVASEGKGALRIEETGGESVEQVRRTTYPATLSSSTEWRMFLSLRDPARNGEAGEVTEVAVRVRFVDERDYEPPQGFLEVLEDNPSIPKQGKTARWTLSEAPDERKGGLWVWGLFKEPLYPFLLLQLENLEIPLKGGGSIRPGMLFIKADHRREADLGATLNTGFVGVREVERIKADPLGMAEVDVTEVKPCGKARFRPV